MKTKYLLYLTRKGLGKPKPASVSIYRTLRGFGKPILLIVGITGLFLICFTALNAQSISSWVIGNAGNYQSAGSGNLHWTIGETILEEFGANPKLSQGFHQTYTGQLLVTSIWTLPESNVEVNVFPNPTSQTVTISTSLESEWEVKVYNMLGQQVKGQSTSTGRMQLNVSDLAAGQYMIGCWKEGRLFQTVKVQKH